jgi:hypothetical protein
MQSAFFSFYLLEAQAISLLAEVVQRRPGPLLVVLGILLSEAIDVFTQLLELLFELALWLARA